MSVIIFVWPVSPSLMAMSFTDRCRLSANRKLAGTGFPDFGMPLQAQTAQVSACVGSAPMNPFFYSEEAGANAAFTSTNRPSLTVVMENGMGLERKTF